MEKSPHTAATGTADGGDALSSALETIQTTDPSPSSDNQDQEKDAEPPLSKNQLKKRRRWEKAQAIKKRRKEQSREARRLKAKEDGRDLAAERQQQLANEKEGRGWKKREEWWKKTMEKADIDNSFRVCFDCAFEDRMTRKETNSLSLQLRYTYAVNRKSVMPVYIDVCGLEKGSQTRGHMEKVEGFPERWKGRAFICYEEGLEEVYGRSVDKIIDFGADADEVKQCDEKVDGKGSSAKSDAASTEGVKNESNDAADKHESGEQPYPNPTLRPNHQFVYLTGDSSNTLTALNNNTTYIIGGIVDRNRLKRAAIERAESIAAKYPSLDIKTARLPLDENIDFKGSTRILTCNHVFEILQRYRENGYSDWKGSIMAVLPCRKDLEEKDDEGKEKPADEEKQTSADAGTTDFPGGGSKDFVPV